MKLKIEIELDNAAFYADCDAEVSRILAAQWEAVAELLASTFVSVRDPYGEVPPGYCPPPNEPIKLRDANGNSVGTVQLAE